MASPAAVRKAPSGLMALKQIVEGTSSHTGEEFFRSLVMHLAKVLDAHGVWVTEYLEDQQKLRSLAFWLKDKYVDEYEYALADTPCEVVVKNDRLCHIPDRVVELYPRDPDLKPLGAVSYMGLALKGDQGEVLGHLALLDNKPMQEVPEAFAIFRIFAARAESEMKRLLAERRLARSQARLNRLVNGTMDAMLELDGNLNITQCNQSAAALFQTECSKLLGAPLQQFFTVAGQAMISQSLRKVDALDPGSKAAWIPGYLDCVQPSGKTVPTEATLSAYESDGAIFYSLFLRNVEDRVVVQEKNKLLQAETASLREQVHAREFDDIIGRSPGILQALEMVRQVGPTASTVLICGETGTGKELFARAVHRAGPRSARPYVTLNCAALPAELVESELFGHTKGAFTGATETREGRFGLADGGTLFLDEIGELPQALQAKLLRVLQEGEFEPVGSSKTKKVNVRVVAATNRDLLAEVQAGKFREDLYYRLNVFPIDIPPLRDRGEDVLLLAQAFIDKYCKRYSREACLLNGEDQTALTAYRWPGNVRELQNIVERALIISRDGPVNLRSLLHNHAAPQPVGTNDDRILTDEEMRRLETENIRRAMDRAGWKIYGPSGAAELLGIPGTTLSSRINKLGLKNRGQNG